MCAVHGYETKSAEIVSQMRGGYPRFVLHRFVQQLTAHYAALLDGTGERTLWLTSSEQMAAQLAAELARSGAQGTTHHFDGVSVLSHEANLEATQRARLFLQNTGGFLSSRAAEDRLVALGLTAAASHETALAGNSLEEIQREFAPLFSGCAPHDLLIANCGMNALYAAFSALADAQVARGRRVWVQVGWLYLDTIALLKRHAQSAVGEHLYFPDVFDLTSLERLFAERGAEIAGLIIEAPTNPLIQTPDLPEIHALAQKYGASVIVDPSVSSIYSVDVLPYADVVCASLTKYTASEGDLVAGLVVVNPAHAEAAVLRRAIAAKLEPVYSRDLARLAHEIGHTRGVMAQIERSVPRVVAWLEAQAAVKEVAWAHSPHSWANYERIARSSCSVGGLISFTLHKPIERFYDAVRLPKGPSFGMKTTLLCPFIYLAHYDLVATEEGRRELAASGLAPELLRLSIGCEPVEEIIAALAEAFALLNHNDSVSR